MRYSDLLCETIIERRNWYHISDDPDLQPSHGHKPRQGQLGLGFYVTTQPKVWQVSLGKRQFLYKVLNPHDFNIATEKPSHVQLADWAIEHGFMEMRPVIKQSGEVILDDDGEPLVRPDITEKGQRLLWQDPMTGGKMAGLENQYLIDHGFDGYEAGYSRDGHQIILFDPSKVKLKRLQNR